MALESGARLAVSAPSLPGCWSQGETEEEARANIAVAIREYLEAEVEPSETAPRGTWTLHGLSGVG
jgi:predicted RNase H-like HicB family nuclease